MLQNLVIFLGKIISTFSERLSLGAGGTWPGEIALALQPNIFQYFASRFSKGIVLVAGTNGKTTTSLMIKSVLESDNQRVVHNDSGANLLNGLVSACMKYASWNGSFQAEYGVFEVDENALGGVIAELKIQTVNCKLIIVMLNLFRDQLDRYGEVDVIAEKWEKALAVQKSVKSKVESLVVNADDPLIVHIAKAVSSSLPAGKAGPGLEARVVYFGINEPKMFQKEPEHATDSIFCLNCGTRLTYDGIYFSHIGIWKCQKCGEKRPTPTISSWKSPLPGFYNTYNTLAAVSVLKNLGYKDQAINTALSTFTPAFGRQEEFEIDGPSTSGSAGLRGVNKKVKIFLSKNPAGFNESLKTVLELGATQLLLVLNDRIPDGRDVSWIWDVDFEMLYKDEHVIEGHDQCMITLSGDRVYDLALRLKYAESSRKSVKLKVCKVEPELRNAISIAIDYLNNGQTLYILATYSAMLEVRKILTGKKI